MKNRPKTVATRRSALAALACAVMVASALALVPGAAPASADVVSSSLEIISDGTGHGTSSACQLTDGPTLADAGPSDAVVCTNDTVTFGWSFSLDEDGADDVVFEQQLPLEWSWDPLSTAACQGNGIDYTGTATISPDGRTLTCVLNQPPSSSTASLQIPLIARVGAAAPNLSTYAGVLTVTDPSGTPQVSTADPITVRARPRFELVKTPTGGQGSLGNIDFGNGAEPAYYADFYASIEVPNASNPKGIEPLSNPFTFVENFEGISPNAVINLIYGQTSGTPTSTQPGGPGTPATITVSGATTSAFVPPTFLGSNVVWHARIRIALPTSEVPAQPVGKDIVNRYSDFLPIGVNGTANFDGVPEQGSEAGADCEYLEDPNLPNVANDNCAEFFLTGPGGTGGPGQSAIGYKRIYQREPAGVPCGTGPTDITLSPACPLLPGDTGSENGYAIAGDPLWARVYLLLPRDNTNATIPASNMAGCDSWDPQLQQVDPSGTLKFGYPNDIPSSEYTVEYTNRVLANDAARQAAPCGIPGDATTAGPWFSSIAAAGGPSAVSGVRVTYTGAPTFGVGGASAGQQIFLFSVPMVAGTIPGAVPDFFTARWDELVTAQNPTGSRYSARAGYRNTAQLLAVDKDTAPPGNTFTATGATVDFTLTPTVTVPGNPSPPPTTGLTVTDALDPCMLVPTLSPASTDWTMTIATPANLGPDGLPCTGDGEAGAVLLFEHAAASVSPNQPVQPISYSIVVSQFVANAANITNTAVVDADGNSQVISQRTDSYTMAVAAPGGVKVSKTADVPVVEVAPDDVSWTILFSNTVLAPATAGYTEFIDVLPYAGDGRGTSFSGDYDVVSIDLVGTQPDVSLVYTSEPPATIDPDPATNVTSWCADTSFGSPGCPADLASVTAFKLVNQDFVKQEVGGVKVTLSPNGNVDGDTYVNSVGLGRTENLPQPVPATPPAPVQVVASTIGDLVWMDANSDGVVDAGTEDGIAGVRVNLYDQASNLLEFTDTAPDGSYAFTDLHSGTYRAALDPSTLPAGASQTFDLDGGIVNPDRDSGAVTLGVDVDRTDVDFGEFVPDGPPDPPTTTIDPGSTNPPSVAGTGNQGVVDSAGTGGTRWFDRFDQPGELARTGSATGSTVLAGTLLLGAGAVLLLIRRRRVAA